MSAGKTSTADIVRDRRYHRAPGGFTLLELIVVLVIVGLVSALAAPRMIRSLTRMHLKTSAQKITSALRYARSQAVSEQKMYAAVFDFEKNGCFVGAEKKDETEDPYAAAEAAAAQTEDIGEYGSDMKAYVLPEGVRIEKGLIGEEEIESESFKIEFFPAGNSGGGKVVIIDEKENRFQIDVDPITGIVKLTETDE